MVSQIARSSRPRSSPIISIIKALFSSYLLVVFVATVVLGWIASPYFLTARNIENVLAFAAVVSVLAIGEFFVIVTGGIDLSVGSVIALTTVVAAVSLKAGLPPILAALIALAVAALTGSITGLLVVKAKIMPFVATLAIMTIARGVSYLIQFGSLISISDNTFIDFLSGKTGPVPHPVFFFLAIMVIAALVMRYTTFGRSLYAIGGNSEAARLSGLPVDRRVFSVYMLCGLLSGVAGLIMAAQLTQGSSLLAQGYELDAIAAVVVGGASLAGGTGDPIGAVVGGLIMGIIGNVMNLMGIPSEPQMVVKGILILVAVLFITGDGMGRLRKNLQGVKWLKGIRPAGGVPQGGECDDEDEPAAAGQSVQAREG